jgi:RNA polymerase sigma factor (TIGR02999 family)
VTGSSPNQITELLARWSQGDEHALDSVVPLVYKDLRRIASHLMKGERPGHTLQPTELANQVYIKLKDEKKIHWQNRAHFMAVAARAMRQILVDHARNRGRQKRGGGISFTTLNEETAAADHPVDLLDLNRALDHLAAEQPRKARVLELKLFGGLSHEEISQVLQISTITVIRDWNFAIALLRSALDGPHPHG